MADDALTQMLRTQARVCATFGSPFYAGLLERAGCALDGPLGELLDGWRGRTLEALIEAAVALRVLGALHELALSGDAPALTAAFPPAASDPDLGWRAASAALETHVERLRAFLDHEPQTNEVRRSACLLPGFLAIAQATGLPLRCLELGASAGLNQLWPRFRYDYGAAGAWGDAASPVRLCADWTGASVPALDARLSVVESRACDRKPIDLSDPIQRRRLKAYLWPDQTERILRFDAAADLATAAGVAVETADALVWTRAHAAPQAGLATVIFHSIFQQYLPRGAQADLAAAVAEHGAAASRHAPLAWLRMEPSAASIGLIELRLTLWPGGEDRRLAVVQAHGAWVRWGADD
jgi:hypothetical protein